MIPACLLRTNWSELHSNDDNCPLDWRGVPGASLIAFGVLILGIIQIGPSVILIPVIIWSWMTMETWAALIFTAYIVPVNLIDNVLRPIIFTRGLKTPMLVIIVGVIVTASLIGWHRVQLMPARVRSQHRFTVVSRCGDGFVTIDSSGVRHVPRRLVLDGPSS